MRPTLVAFTPWTTARDYLELLAFVAEHDLVEHIDPVQYSIRLLIPPGSALLQDIQDSPEGSAKWLSDVDEAAFTYRWHHPDARMDGLQPEISALVEIAAREHWDNGLTFEEICALAEAYLGEPMPLPVSQAVPPSPGGVKKAAALRCRTSVSPGSAEQNPPRTSWVPSSLSSRKKEQATIS